MKASMKGWIVLGLIIFLFATIAKAAKSAGVKTGDFFKSYWKKDEGGVS